MLAVEPAQPSRRERPWAPGWDGPPIVSRSVRSRQPSSLNEMLLPAQRLESYHRWFAEEFENSSSLCDHAAATQESQSFLIVSSVPAECSPSQGLFGIPSS